MRLSKDELQLLGLPDFCYQGNKEFATGWFFDYEGDVYQKLVSTIPDSGTMVEVGSWEGLSLFYIKDIIKSKNIKCWSVDIDNKSRLLSNTKEWGVEFIHAPSVHAAKLFDDNSLDLVFLDGDHTYKSVVQDIVAWFPKIKENGILAGHDYDDFWPGVKQGVNEALSPIRIVGRIWMYKSLKILL